MRVCDALGFRCPVWDPQRASLIRQLGPELVGVCMLDVFWGNIMTGACLRCLVWDPQRATLMRQIGLDLVGACRRDVFFVVTV